MGSLKQAELAKPKDYFNGNSQRSSPKTVIRECSPQAISEPEKKANAHRDIIKEQERLLEEASANLRKQKQLQEQIELDEQTSTLPLKASNIKFEALNELNNRTELDKSNYEEFETRKEMQVPTQKAQN